MAKKIQLTLTNSSSIRIYEQLKQGLKAKAIETALLKLVLDETTRNIFFDDNAISDIEKLIGLKTEIIEEDSKIITSSLVNNSNKDDATKQSNLRNSQVKKKYAW